MRVLILGATGMLGTDLLDEWRKHETSGQKTELFPAGSADADVRDPFQVDGLKGLRLKGGEKMIPCSPAGL